MNTAQSTARQRLIELLRLTPQTNMLEGYLMALQNAVDDYVHAILHDFPERVDEDPRLQQGIEWIAGE